MHIEMKNICKNFDDVRVLDNACLEIASGEVHALLGENGAGKSTLMKILTGVYTKDSGQITIDGVEKQFSHPKEAEKEGIYFVYQELSNIPDMTIEENLFLGKERHGALGLLHKKEMRTKTEKLLAQLDLHLDPKKYLRDMSVGQQQLVEIAKAFLSHTKTIILDEPTAALSEKEVEKLFSLIRLLKAQGVSFIYISHRLVEIFEICDRATVMRDGKFIAQKNINEVTNDSLVRLMIGRDLGNLFQKKKVSPGKEILAVKNLTKAGLFSDVSFSLHAGEILGVAGLVGAGRSEIMKTIYGAFKATGGEMYVRDQKINLHSYNPRIARENGFAFITEDRKDEGLLIDKSISTNIDLTNFGIIANRYGVIQKKKAIPLALEAINIFKIACHSEKQICSNLSGGNQQKVVFAKWVYTEPQILILDEPTRGVDVGAKQEIYGIMSDLVSKGMAIIMVSSELPEIIGMSDRVLVIHEGRVAGEIAQNITEEKIMTLATGGSLND